MTNPVPRATLFPQQFENFALKVWSQGWYIVRCRKSDDYGRGPRILIRRVCRAQIMNSSYQYGRWRVAQLNNESSYDARC
jgi:hypothetical protein